MGAPQTIMIALFAISLGISLAKHGQYREDKYNFYYSLIAMIIEVSILYWGGFFK